jgi:hypothetical protein
VAIFHSKHGYCRLGFASLLLGLAVANWPEVLFAQAVRSHEEAARVLVIDKPTVRGDAVAGQIRNRSSHAVRDVQLFIRYTWLWDNEFKPGKDDPGVGFYHVVPKEIPAGGTARFEFKPTPPLSKPLGGHFETSVTIAGFTEVIPRTK